MGGAVIRRLEGRIVEKYASISDYSLDEDMQLTLTKSAIEIREHTVGSKSVKIVYWLDEAGHCYRRTHYSEDFWDITKSKLHFRFSADNDRHNRELIAEELRRRAEMIRQGVRELLAKADTLSQVADAIL